MGTAPRKHTVYVQNQVLNAARIMDDQANVIEEVKKANNSRIPVASA
jgi:hypothetical protein